MNIAIVGGGITGLTIAQELLKRDHRVTVFERYHPGGLAGGIPFPGRENVYLDVYYHHIFKTDREINDLIVEHGLDDDLLWLESRTGIFAAGRHWPFGTPRELLSFSPMGNLWQRLLMGLNLLHFKRVEKWKPLDRISCRDFFSRRGNLTGYRNLWEPLLEKKFADAYDRIPASFLWGRIHPRAKSRAGGRESLGYLKGGFQRLVETMVETIRQRGGTVLTDTRVLRATPGNTVEIVSPRGREVFDRAVWTIGLDLLPELVADVAPETAGKALAIDHVAVTCLALILKKKLGDFYWVNNIDPEVRFGAAIEHTNFVSPEDYGGKHILYVASYHRRDCRFHQAEMEEYLEKITPSLRMVFPRFSRELIERSYLFKNSHSCPVYDVGYLDKMPPYHGWLPGIDICSMAQVYPEDRNMNHCARNALQYIRERYDGV